MALPELLANSPTPGVREAYTTLSAELNTGETTMTWAKAPPPSCRGTGAAGIGGQFRVVIGSEIILCEAGGSTTVKILARKEEESTEAAHANASQVWIVPTNEGIQLTSGTLTEVITSTKKWIKPKHAQYCAVTVIGGGGGGGSGSESAEKIECSGGGGGGGAASNFYVFSASVITPEVECTIGKGGVGGKNRATVGEGEAGKEGGVSHFGELLYANGGKPGGAGKAGTGGTAGGVNVGIFPGNAGAAGEAKGNGKTVVTPTGGGAAGGGGGGGSTTTEAKAGGNGGHSLLGSEANAEGGSPGVAGKEGAEGLAQSGLPGHGGGGGGSGFDASAGKGGAGGKYGGGGGGGGGASKEGSTTGEGGAGGEGAIIIVTGF